MTTLPMKTTGGLISKAGGLSKIGPTAAASAFTEVVGAIKEYKLTKLQVAVDIAKIEAERERAVAIIQAKRDLMTAYFEQAYAERERTFDKGFELLDHAIETGNMDVLNGALTVIVKTIESSPLADFASFNKAIQDPGTSFTF